MNQTKRLKIAVICGLFAIGGLHAQLYVPTGVQTNVGTDTVFDTWGWEVAYQDLYSGTGWGNAGTAIATVFENVQPGEYVMLAAKQVGSDTFTLLAAALESDVRTYTALNMTHLANGAEWYYNGYSMGFAGAGDSINQTSADTGSVNAALRLSWHTSGPDSYLGEPAYLNPGWRAGATTSLNAASNWERYVLVGSAIPEPSVVGMFAVAGLAGIVCWRKRMQRSLVT